MTFPLQNAPGKTVCGFLAALALTAGFTAFHIVRSVRDLVYWRQHADEPIQPWMTIGFVAHSYHVPPPVLATAITLHVQRAQMTNTDPNPVFMALAAGAFRQSVMTMMRVAGPKFAEAAEAEAKMEAEFGQTADGLGELLLYGPQLGDMGEPGDIGAAEAAEDDSIRRAQGMM